MLRRSFAFSLAAAPLAASPAPPTAEAAKIKFTGVEIFPLAVNNRGGWVIARIQTDAGLTGLGDASHSGRNDPAIAKLREYAELMQGRSIYDIERLRQQAHADYAADRRAASCAFSAIEQALFDVQGQAAGAPCWALFGGKLRDRVRNYANINRSTDVRTPEGFVETAKDGLEAGFTAFKMASFDGMPRRGSTAEREAHTQLGVDAIAAVRELIGPERDLLVDAHNNFGLDDGLDLLKRLEPFELYWLEEVSRPYETLAALRQAAPMPIAGGESLFGVKENWEYLRAEPVDTLMPDVKYAGGMLELKKIAAMAEGAGVAVAPHGPASPIGNMAAAHVCVTLPNFQILEYSQGDAPWRAELTDPPEPLESGGMLRVFDTPGLGFQLNMKTVGARRTS